MKQSKQFLLFSLTLFGFAAVECVLTALLSPLLEDSLFLTRTFPFVARALALIPPFLTLGTAVGATRVRSLSYALSFFGIYAAVTLFFQIPLSLLAYSPANSAPYAILLLSYMISALATVLLFFLSFLLAYAIFLKEGEGENAPLFSLNGGEARAVALCALILTLYHLVREVIDIFAWARDNLYIISAEDLISMLFSLFFFLVLGAFCFATGRVATHLFPTAPLEEITDEDDSV